MTQTSRAFAATSMVPFYSSGLMISNDNFVPTKRISVSSGIITDSTATFQLSLPSSVIVDARYNGVNGIDTGSLVASTVYAVFIVADPINQNNTGCLISLSYTAPYLPYGYSAFALIGYLTTDSSANILRGFWSTGNSSLRQFTYDVPILCLTGGTSASFASINLTSFVPSVDNTSIIVNSDFYGNAPGNLLVMRGGRSQGNQVLNLAPIAGSSGTMRFQNTLLSQLVNNAPNIAYYVSAGFTNIYVSSYLFDI